MLRASLIGTQLCAALLLASSSIANSATLRVPLKFDLFLYETVEKVTEVCDVPDPRNPGKLTRVVGCMKPSDGSIHAVRPKSWCDTNAIETLGHELMHRIGFHHGPQFVVPHIPEGVAGCKHGEFWNPPANPRPKW